MEAQKVTENEYLLLEQEFLKGDDIQKLSVIQALPQLLQYDPNGTITRIIPKIQQELPKSSCEFHLATSKIFKILIEKQLPVNLIGAVIQGTESKDPVVSNAWIETLLAVIPILQIEQIKANVIPLALSKSQTSSPVYCRVASCKIFGKCAAHPQMQSLDVKTSILPPVQSLCQDCFQDVRATMCSHLHFVAQGLGENLVKSSLLPSLVELASDDNMTVRSAAVAAAVLIIPFLNKQTKVDTIIPLIKQLCSKAGAAGDTTFPTIAHEFGKLIWALQNDLDQSDCVWVLEFYKTLASKGQAVRLNKDNSEVNQDVLCREQCALNLPYLTGFTMSRIQNRLELWHTIFAGLANDSCYLVRKTTASCISEVTKLLGAHCKIIKDDFVKLLRDDAEEVLHLLVPHVGLTLEQFAQYGVLSRDVASPACIEVTKALLKCHAELSKGYNWRVKSAYFSQLEKLPQCMPSDFIHQHFSPIVLTTVLEARAKPVRSQASRTLLVFLRYNLKEVQRKWIHDNLLNNLCNSNSCYTRHVFILACGHAAEIFSNSYFKKYFFEALLSLADDPVSNIRLCVVSFLSTLYKMLVMPEDRKLQSSLDNIFKKLDSSEKDKDVKEILKAKFKEIRTAGASHKQDYIAEQKRKEDEESKILQGKLPAVVMSSKPAQPASPQMKPPQNAPPARPAITTRSTAPRPTKSPSTMSNASIGSSGSGPGPSDMSFLEQHFYIDAGISLPVDNLAKIQQKEHLDEALISNLSIDDSTKIHLKRLETSSNITDDAKVNLRKRNTITMKSKRFSMVYSSASETKMLKRRSLNIPVSGGISRIPICVKKVQSYDKIISSSSHHSMTQIDGKNVCINSAISKENDVPKRSDKQSALPTLKRRVQSSDSRGK